MIRVGIIGATGYAGIELVRLLYSHPDAIITQIISQSFVGKKISDVYPHLKGILDIECRELNTDELSAQCDVVFTSLPQGTSGEVIPSLYNAGCTIIDLSADFRFHDATVYEQWYKMPHPAPQLLPDAIYGLPELHRADIAKARLVGNPGCYPTATLLGLAPAVKAGAIDTSSIIVDAKSGVSGAGRASSLEYSFCECDEDMRAYKVAQHRHTPEIEQELSILAQNDVVISFTPHLIPMKRGILATIYATLKDDISLEALLNIYKNFYKDEPFVHIYENGTLPSTKAVAGSNHCHIGLTVDERTHRIIITSAIDNLVKGAAGQAVQNMNIMLGLNETAGLASPGYYL